MYNNGFNRIILFFRRASEGEIQCVTPASTSEVKDVSGSDHADVAVTIDSMTLRAVGVTFEYLTDPQVTQVRRNKGIPRFVLCAKICLP